MANSMRFTSLQHLEERAAPSAARHTAAARPQQAVLGGVHYARRCSSSPAAAGQHAQAVSATAPAPSTGKAEDRWIAHALDVVTTAGVPQSLAALHSSCLAALATMRMPTTKNEEYRFTDVGPIMQSALVVPDTPPADAVAAAVAQHQLQRRTAATVVVVNGLVQSDLSSRGGVPSGTYVGGVEGAPADVVSFALGAQSRGRGGVFATLNGAATRDAVVVHVPANTAIDEPIHVLYLSSAGGSGSVAASAPRLVVLLEEGASAEVVEEFAALDPQAGAYFCNAVAEFELDDGSSLTHGYAELDARPAFHLKSTLVKQGEGSSYALTEARLGGALTRHDIGVDQVGARTSTSMDAFLLSGASQLHDLHSKLKLDHPEGQARQLHKCIVAHPSGRGVFDGNVRVNRLAQRTDAQQLSRNLLLAPRATVNVKPNLQIVADDVKCTHGCTVSDLEDEELFYLRARGINTATARQMLVYSFGREVLDGLKDKALISRVESSSRATLAAAGTEWAAAVATEDGGTTVF